MANTWDVKLATEADSGDLPGRVDDIADWTVVLGFVDQAAQVAGRGAFLVSITGRDKGGWAMLYGCPWGWSLGLQDDFGPEVSDVYTTRGPVDADEAWDFGRLFGQELEWSRRYFTEPKLVRQALTEYLSTGKLWRGVVWEPEPGAGLLIDR